ncbi:MAG: hypothetical protein NC421_03785, partial [Lachnospiraceae bacterium]|nr:hypothetical protein [Lachnospiraceae bacterium]
LGKDNAWFMGIYPLFIPMGEFFSTGSWDGVVKMRSTGPPYVRHVAPGNAEAWIIPHIYGVPEERYNCVALTELN